jgi:hypothetical protein
VFVSDLYPYSVLWHSDGVDMHWGTQHTRVCREDIDINRLTGSRSRLLLAADLDIASVQVASADLSDVPSSCLDCCPIEQNSWERAHIDVSHSLRSGSHR